MKGCLIIIIIFSVMSVIGSIDRPKNRTVAEIAQAEWNNLEGQCSYKAKQLGSDWERMRPFIVSNTFDNKNGLITINIKHKNGFGVLIPFKVFCKIKDRQIIDVLTKRQPSLAVP
jgi:hypothetical protein